MIGNKYTTLINSKLPETLSLRDIKDGWKEVKKGQDLVLSQIKYKDNEIKMAKIEGVIPVNYEKAADFYFSNLEGQKQNRKMCDKLVKLEDIDNDTVITLFKTKSKFVVSSREVIGVQHKRRLSATEILITRDSINEHPNAPVNKDVVRAEGKFFAIFLTKINENTTKMSVYMLMDPKGSIPTSFVNSMVEEQLDAAISDVELIKKL